MLSTDPSSLAQSRGILRDFTDAIGQQLYFWGRDVIHPEGNLLCQFGLQRRKSTGLEGTSCYSMSYEGDLIELHGACVGRYSNDSSGFLYIRNRKRCFVFRGEEPPVPGFYIDDHLERDCIEQLHIECRKFLKWWLEYEVWIASVAVPEYRAKCYATYRKLPQSKPWLEPYLAIEWLSRYASDPFETVKRARALRIQAVAI